MDSSPDNLNLLFTKLRHFLKTETVVGTPIYLGQIILVPLVKICFGLGTGVGGGKDDEANNLEGLGAGASIIPHTILVVVDNEVSILPLKEKSKIDEILDMAPDIINRFRKEDETCKF